MARTKEDIDNIIESEQRALSSAFEKYQIGLLEARSINTGSLLSTNMAQGMAEEFHKKLYDEEKSRIDARIAELVKERKTAPDAQQPKQPTSQHASTRQPSAPPAQMIYINPGATAESLTERGFIFLEESDWTSAKAYFSFALDKSPRYAPAYVGLLCVKLKVTNEAALANNKEPLTFMSDFRNALRFANEDYCKILVSYNDAIKKRTDEKIRIDEENQLSKESQIKDKYYSLALQAKSKAKTTNQVADFHHAIWLCRDIRGYKDVDTIVDECEKSIQQIQVNAQRDMAEKTYTTLLEQKRQAEENNRNSIHDIAVFHDLATKFRRHEYRDSEALAVECARIVQQINVVLQQAEEERQRKKLRQEQLRQEEKLRQAQLKQEEEQRRIAQSRQWESQGLCRYCGGKLGFLGKCKLCGRKN